MTITDNGRVDVDEQTLVRARELTAGGRMPSKREMQKHLGKRWEVVNEVLTVLGKETREAAERRRGEARRAMRQLSSRKHPGSVRPARLERQRTVNEIAAFRPLELPSGLVGAGPLEAGQKHLGLPGRAVNGMAAPLLAEVPLGPARPPVREAVEEHPVVEPVAVNEPRRVVTWPALVVAAPAFVAIWAGWVAIGKMTGFGRINLLPGFGKGWVVDTAITLPVGVEAYAAYAFYVALNPTAPRRARQFGGWSAALAVLLGMGGQTAYHLMAAAKMTAAPWWITTVVSCLPVAVFGLTAALVHMVHAGDDEKEI